MTPETQYARAGDAHIAYQVLGEGPIDIVLADQWFSHMDAQWDVPPLAKFRERLASFSRLIMFDKRGVGLSDPVPLTQLPLLEEWIDDVRAVMDAAGSERASVVTNIGGTLMSVVLAAAMPDRVSSLVIVNGFARNSAAPDYPMGPPLEVLMAQLDTVEEMFGRGLMLTLFAPTVAGDELLRTAFGRYERQSVSPGTARAMVSMIYQSDVRDVLPAIRVPTLVIHRRDVQNLPIAMGRYLAEHIPGAKFVELPGVDNLIWAGDQDSVIGEIQEFTTGVRTLPEPDRVLATVMFTDIVDSTVRAAALGDRQWRELLNEHDRLVRASLASGGGREIKTTGDGFLATFDGPARAVRAAGSIRDAVAGIGLQVRAGLHTGEIELAGNDVAGVAVHIASRVASLASAGEILVSSTVKDLVAGSGIAFESRGEHALKGIPDEWRLFAVTEA